MKNNTINTATTIISNFTPVNDNWEQTQIIDTAFIDTNGKEHHIYVSFEKIEGLGARVHDFDLAEELTAAIKVAIEKLFKSKLVGSHCTWKILKDGILKNSCIEFAPEIYNNPILKSLKSNIV